ncbi:MAG: hypothetical protein R2710_18940 [Acidimicrobiales bacterium]
MLDHFEFGDNRGHRAQLITLPDGELGVVKTPLAGDRRDRSAEAHWLERAAALVVDPTSGSAGSTDW